MNFTEAKEYIINRLVNELSEDLVYHGAHHTFAVVKSAAKLAVSEQISRHDYNLLLTAAYFHDCGFLYQYKKNEPIAMKIVQEELPKFDYSEDEINIISNIISATQSQIEPKTLLEKIICDADHDYLGTVDYHRIASTLRAELVSQNIVYTETEWVELQYDYLLNRHVYYTQTAIDTRLEQKTRIIEEMAKILNVKVK